MKKDITSWINETLYPTVFERIDTVFTEHSFKQYAGGWRSNTYLNGERAKDNRKDKTVITKKAPTRILENGGESLTLIDYVMRRDSLDFIGATKRLANSVGLELPNSSNFDAGAYQKHRERLDILEATNNYFIDKLHDPKDKGAIEALTYLKSRGYSVEDIKAMELGYIPSQRELFTYLESSYSRELIKEALHLHKDIGVVNKLSIPFRTGGNLKGFSFRTTGKEEKNKYLNSTGLRRGEALFNLLALKGDKDIVVVEGLLDALIATARGVENVVALGGVSLGSDAIRDALRRGAKSFTLCLDNDEAGATGVERSIEALLKEGVNRIYIVTLEGDNKLDVDDIIRDKGVEAFKELLRKHTPHYLYRLNNIFIKYSEIEKKESRELTQKEVDNLLEEVVNLSTTVREPLDRDIFNKNFLKHPLIQTLGITEKSLEKTRKDITSKEAQREAIKQLNSKTLGIQKALKENNTEEAFKLVKQAQRLEAQATELSNLYKVTTREEIIERAKNSPSGVYSGYYVNVIGEDEPYKINLPAGALTVVAGATGHGKSTLLYNMALNIAESTDKNVHFFTLEEHSDELIKKTLISYINRKLSQSFAKNCEEAITQYYKYGNETLINSDVRDEFKRLEAQYYKEFIHSNKLKFDFSSYDCETLVQAIYSLKDNTNIGVIFIDYVQIINLKESRSNSRQGEVKKIMEMLKDVSVNTGLPIVLGSQFNRTVTNHLELVNTNLGEAGDIERGANLILAIWNNNDPNKKINENSKTEFKIEITNKGYNATNTLYIKTLKNRGGRADIQGLLTWNGNTKVIESFSNSELDRLAYAIGDDIEDAGSFGAIPTPPKEKENTLPF